MNWGVRMVRLTLSARRLVAPSTLFDRFRLQTPWPTSYLDKLAASSKKTGQLTANPALFRLEARLKVVAMKSTLDELVLRLGQQVQRLF